MATTETSNPDDESSVTNEYNSAATTRRETAPLLAELLEQHAGRRRPRCTAPNCFSTEGIGYVKTEGDDEPRPMCAECRSRYGAEL